MKRSYIVLKKKYINHKNYAIAGSNKEEIVIPNFDNLKLEEINENIQVNLLWLINDEIKNIDYHKEKFKSHINEQTPKWERYKNVVFWHDFNDEDIKSIQENISTHITFMSVENLEREFKKELEELEIEVKLYTRIDYNKNEILLYQMNNPTNECEYIIFSDLDIISVENFLKKKVFNNNHDKTIKEALDEVGIIFAKKPTSDSIYENSFFIVKKNDQYVKNALTSAQEQIIYYFNINKDLFYNKKLFYNEQSIYNMYVSLFMDILYRKYYNSLKNDNDQFDYYSISYDGKQRLKSIFMVQKNHANFLDFKTFNDIDKLEYENNNVNVNHFLSDHINYNIDFDDNGNMQTVRNNEISKFENGKIKKNMFPLIEIHIPPSKFG